MGFQIGDRVVTTVDFSRENVGSLYENPDIMCGMEGTVVRVRNRPDEKYGVEFDDRKESFHDCHGYSVKNHGWYIPGRFLELYEDFDICVSKDELFSILGTDSL